jgi:hypothetical protein
LTLAGGTPKVSAHALVDLELVASLPADATPADLDGILQLQLVRQKGPATPPLDVTVEGAPPLLSGIAIAPATLTLHAVSWLGPISRPSTAHASIELRGPGVPSLFRQSGTLSTLILLRSGSGHEVPARLVATAPAQDGDVASGRVEVFGTLSPGTYDGELPLSNLSAGGPHLSLTLQSSDSFIWALLAVGLGALIGGGIYLASERKRRKSLLEGNLKDGLSAYAARRAELRTPGPSPLWDVSELGDEASWFQRKWTALPQIAGVQGIWTEIFWARTENDLNEAEKAVIAVLERVGRWLLLAQGEDLGKLKGVVGLDPLDPPGQVWERTKACFDTSLLLRELREVEPRDDADVRSLIERLVRQARWHAALATTWHMKGTVAKDMAVNEGNYTALEKEAIFNKMDLSAIDTAAHPERTRTAEKQLELETELDTFRERLDEIYKGPGNLSDLEVPGPEPARELGSLTADQARRQGDVDISLPADLAPAATAVAEAPPPQAPGSRRDRLRAAASRTPGWLTAITTRDLLWSAVIVIVTLCAYVPTFYGPSWGSLGDYGTAFLAGFLTKTIVNWALLPAFASLAVRLKPA